MIGMDEKGDRRIETAAVSVAVILVVAAVLSAAAYALLWIHQIREAF